MTEAQVYPGITELKAEPPMPGHGPLWQINGLIEGGAPDDDEAWGWIAEVSPAWADDDKDDGELARFLVRAAHAHAPLVEALSVQLNHDGHTARCASNLVTCLPDCAMARAALALARGDGRP